ncbi:helix-turn-helix domain-containing protein [Kaistia geumhonensis]|uniref:Transcriptional regulator with XRE-family HTH domain n=1 Tax=Kaistia geumhonensis TaxID=410839 RepID=A0ABU0M210_9HYPH|nr:helix-turn-helix domain-containing protein [Kaistia geumhonensis]MCX5479785.1 helix-turn-helix domain-containing protein [Kaistia geumhonensis]MDQ0514990.1 transcriptional regulator with XRE-family HTH domain [Kaistia geumhonensis]
MSQSPDIGQRIRDMRRQRRLTLQRVAQLCGLSVGFLSQVERNITRPSLDSLTEIAGALDTTIGSILHQPDLPIAVSRSEGRVAHQVRDSAAAYERLSTSYPGQMLTAIKLTLPAPFQSRTFAFPGEQLTYTLAGTARYVIEGVIFELQPGDSLHFSTARPHRLLNESGALLELLVVSTQQLFDEYHRIMPQIFQRDGAARNGAAP